MEAMVNGRAVDYSALPSHMQSGMRLYLERGILPGGFATAILTNDLLGAFSRADSTNRAAMATWAEWIYNECPGAAHGSRERVAAWCEARMGVSDERPDTPDEDD